MALVEAAVAAAGALGEDAEQLAALAARPRRPRARPVLASPPERSIGIMPIAGKRYFVFHESMYSALPTKLMRRGTVSIRNAESRKLMWFGQRMAPPVGRQAVEALDVDVHRRRGDRADDRPRAVLQLACPVAGCHVRRTLPLRRSRP